MKYKIKFFTFIKPIEEIVCGKTSKCERRKLMKSRRDLGIPILNFT